MKKNRLMTTGAGRPVSLIRSHSFSFVLAAILGIAVPFAFHNAQAQTVINVDGGQSLLDATSIPSDTDILNIGVNSLGAVANPGTSYGVSAGEINLGVTATGVGLLTLSASTGMQTDNLTVGLAGSGYLSTVVGNTTVTVAQKTLIGVEAGSSGTVRVTGNNTLWANTVDYTVVGVSSSNASLQVDAGAIYQTAGMVIGQNAGSQANVLVEGPGTELNVLNAPNSTTQNLIVGMAGKGTLDISGQSIVTSEQGTVVGALEGGVGVVNVKDNGSSLTEDFSMLIGNAGHGTLNISNQGKVTTLIGVVGYLAGSTGIINVADAGSELNVTAYTFYIAQAGDAEVTITNGGLVTAASSVIGVQATGKGKVTVEGTGSAFKNNETLAVATYGQGELYIKSGGYVSSSLAMMASNNNTTATIEVTGSGSWWNNSGIMAIGLYGDANVMISDGGQITNGSYVYLGGVAEASGIVTITGAGSLLSSTAMTVIGLEGYGELTLADGGVMDVTTGAIDVAMEAGSTGIINIGAAAGEAAVAPGSTTAASIVFGNGDGRIVFNHTGNNYDFAPLMTGPGVVDVYAGTTVLTAENDYTGDTTIYAGTLRAGVTNAFSSNSHTDIHVAGILDLAGHDQTLVSIANAGWIYTNTNVGAPGAFLTVGDYVGTNGNIHLNTYLGGDTSASDRLVVTGSASGNSLLHINNIGGPGVATTADGILVVEATGAATTTSDAFMLGSRVAAGAYEYSLYRGGSTSDENWYLRNELIPTPPTDPDPTPGEEGAGNNGGSSTPGTGGNIAKPVYNYRVEVPLMNAVQPVALEYGYAVLGTLHERVGDHFPTSMEPVVRQSYVTDRQGKRQLVQTMNNGNPEREKWFSGAWARVFGDRGFHNNKGQFLKNGSNYNYTFGGIQAGLDVYGRELKDGTVDKAGIYVAYGNIDSRVKGAYYGHAGRIDMDAYSLGAYWTHMSPKGWYTDAVVQGTWYTGDAKSVQGQKIDADGFGFMASLEAGYEFKLDNGYTIEPQAQIIYQHLSFDNTNDAYGRFYFNDAESLRGRIGVRVTKTWNAAEENKPPRLIKAWLRGNIWHEFMGKTKMNVTDVYGYDPLPFQSRLGGTWGEIGAGISGQISDTTTLFATASYNRSFEKKGREAWDGRLGMTVRW